MPRRKARPKTKPGAQQPPDFDRRMARIKARRLYIATPVARNPVWQYTASLASTLMQLGSYGVSCQFQFVIGNSIISKARNELCARFLATDCTDLLFIDDDMQWSPNDVMRLLASDYPLIGGVGRMRVQKPNSDPRVWCWKPLTDAGGHLDQGDMGAIAALGFGAAFMKIGRSVLEKMMTAHPDWRQKPPPDWPEDVQKSYFQFFKQGEEDGTDVGEDYVFCNRWRAMGGECRIDPKIRLGHVGAFTYSGSVAEILQGGKR